MVFPPFYSISLRCRLLEGFSFGFVFGFSLSCRLLEASWFVTQIGCVVEGSGWENELSKKSENATWFFPLCIVSQSGVGFWKVWALGLFFASHRVVGFWKVLVRNSKGLCRGRFWLGKLTEQKKWKRHMVFPLFSSVSFRCSLLEGAVLGLFFCFSLSCRLLEGSGSQLKRAVLWKVLAGKTNWVKKVKTPHGFPSFF